MPTPSFSEASPDRFALLYRLSQTFNSTLDLDEVLNRVIDEVIAATRAERGFLMLREPDGPLLFRVARGMDQRTILEPQYQISRSVVTQVVRDGSAVLTSDAQSDSELGILESVMILGLRSILCVPLKVKNDITGVIYVENRMQVGTFSHSDLELLSSIANSAAIAIENARLYQVAVEKGRLERELQMAREVQDSLLPREIPQIAGWEFAARWQPASHVAGDYYDFIPFDGKRLGVVIADVSGKGMAAALFMAFTRSTIRASAMLTTSPASGIAHANQLICADATRGFFVTLFYAVLDTATGQVTYINAGHNPPLLYRRAEDQLTRLMPTGMALGVDESARYRQETLHLNPGDFTLLYTDGVTDAINGREQFGMERLQQVVMEQRRGSAAEMVQALHRSVEAFSGAAASFDDLTIVMVKCL